MRQPDFLILYVDNPLASATFYAELLGREPAEASPTFAMVPLKDGLMLGLWSRHSVEPATSVQGGGSEIAFRVSDEAALAADYAALSARGLPMLMPPTDLDFGRSFVALDPDGHRLRFMSMAQA